jgi:hypothetical protein
LIKVKGFFEMEKTHSTKEEALAAVQEALDAAQQFGKFMVAVWAAEEEKIHMMTTTWDFPNKDLPVAQAQFNSRCEELVTPRVADGVVRSCYQNRAGSRACTSISSCAGRRGSQ